MRSTRGGLRSTLEVTTTSMRPRVLLIVLLCTIAAVLPSVGRASAAVEATRSLDLELWLAAVRSHVPGEADQAVLTLAPWPSSKLESVVAEVGSSAFVLGPLLKRAAVLHVDIAVLHRNESGYSLPSDGRSVAFFIDRRLVATRTGTIHWQIGRRLLDRLQPDDDIRLWYEATCAFLHSWKEYSELEPHLERARVRFPRDGVPLLYEGMLHVAYALDDPRAIRNASEEKGTAERCFERALALDPDLTEAQLWLAYVRGLRGRHKDAAALLRQAIDRGLQGRMEYHAWLLLGREEAAMGRAEPARDAYTRAMTLRPRAQPPRLGLSLLARAGGDLSTARSVLAPLGESAPSGEALGWAFGRRDPMEVYELVAQMRRKLAP